MVKLCSWDDCEEMAAFSTRTRPAWCDDHITAILRQGGLEPLEAFPGPKSYRMTRCLACGCEAHYRLEYTLEKNPLREPTCRACFWAQWTADTLDRGGYPEEAEPVDPAVARMHAESHGYDYLGPAPFPPAQRTRCRYCGRVAAERMGDISWGCSCQVNPRRARQSSNVFVPEHIGDGPVPRLNPELVQQWHPTANGRLKVEDISPGSRRYIHWREPSCGHEWTDSPAEREKGARLRCPECRTILDSLAWHFPEVATEWSPDNQLSAWQVRPSGQTVFVPEWVCATDSSHRWRMPTNVRTNGSTCPQCRDSGKSMIELRYFEAARSAFGKASSGVTLRHPSFVRRAAWTPDVTVVLPDGRTLLIEYDGAYWHADKAEVDRDKSRDLLASGALVVRLRERPLAAVGIESSAYLELPVSATAPDPEAAMLAIRAWLPAR